MNGWRQSTWGDEISLEYGKAIRGYQGASGSVQVFGSNGPIGWTDKAISQGPGVILGRKGAYRGVQYSQKPFFVIDTAYYVKPKTDLDIRWLYYAIIHHKLGEIDDGSPIPSTTRAAVYIEDVDIPPLAEQREIAATLGVLDDKIELNRKTAATLEEMARALYRSWFVDFDPVRARAEGRSPAHMDAATSALFPDSLGDDGLPVGWERRALIAQANWVNGAAYKNMHFSGERDALPVVKIAELKAGITTGTRFTATDLGARYKINRGELLYSWSGNPDTSIDAFIWQFGPAWLNQHIFAVRENGSMSRAMLFMMLKHFNADLCEIARNKQTTGLGHITKKDMETFLVVLPSSEVLQAFESSALPLFGKYCQTLYETQSLASLRDTLLPRLMSGELRVGAARELIEEIA